MCSVGREGGREGGRGISEGERKKCEDVIKGMIEKKKLETAEEKK